MPAFNTSASLKQTLPGRAFHPQLLVSRAGTALYSLGSGCLGALHVTPAASADPEVSLSLLSLAQGTPKGKGKGLHLQEARGARRVVAHSQPTGVGMGQTQGAKEVGSREEQNPRPYGPGPTPAACSSAQRQREAFITNSP